MLLVRDSSLIKQYFALNYLRARNSEKKWESAQISNVNWSILQVLEGRPQYVEMAGNLIPITKSGDQLYISFKAFRENRLPCLVKIRDRDQEPAARVAFMKEPKVVRGELPQTPICNLNISLPDMSTVRLSFTLILLLILQR